MTLLITILMVSIWPLITTGDDCLEVDFANSTSDSHPFYFGTTYLSINIPLRLRRSKPPTISTKLPKHRFVYYKNCYFEWGMRTYVGKFEARWGTTLAKIKKTPKLEELPAGNSRLRLGCLKHCALNYKAEWGEYSLITNNCHHFVNRLAAILYYSKCPDWCRDNQTDPQYAFAIPNGSLRSASIPLSPMCIGLIVGGAVFVIVVALLIYLKLRHKI